MLTTVFNMPLPNLKCPPEGAPLSPEAHHEIATYMWHAYRAYYSRLFAFFRGKPHAVVDVRAGDKLDVIKHVVRDTVEGLPIDGTLEFPSSNSRHKKMGSFPQCHRVDGSRNRKTQGQLQNAGGRARANRR